MKWFVYVIMMGMYSDGTQDTYLVTTPTHSSLEQCTQYVATNSRTLRMDMMNQFDGKQIERVFCIEERKLRELLELNSQPATKI
jgi:hypothetical protein